MSTKSAAKLDDEVALLAAEADRGRLLIGIRHHSPALALAIPQLLDRHRPDHLFVELPTEAQAWLEHLAADDARAPLALVITQEERVEGFYPFADFSPELAALRWAMSHGVPVTAFDLPISARRRDPATPGDEGEAGRPSLAAAAASALPDLEELWDTQVEARAYGADAERVRRAAIAVGLAQRRAEEREGVEPFNLAREGWMRARLARSSASRPAVVAGAFHLPALAAGAAAGHDAAGPADHDAAGPAGDVAARVDVALIGYDFALLDSRSGYPAGIRDPEWQQAVWQQQGDPVAVRRAAIAAIGRICSAMREAGHVAGTADLLAATGMLDGLSALRRLPAPGRRELIEALASTLGQGEPLGRARAVAAAASKALVGSRRGHPGSGAPRSGLALAVPELLAELSLPGPAKPAALTLRLDPARSALDLRRELALQRMRVIDPGYARPREVAGRAGSEAVTRAWDAEWTPMTDAALVASSPFGVTLSQACLGMLRQRYRSARDVPARVRLGLLEQAARCGLAELSSEGIALIAADVVPGASLADLVAAYRLLGMIGAGLMAGLGSKDDEPARLARQLSATVLAAATGALAGKGGARDLDDARAIVELTQLALVAGLDRGELAWRLGKMADDASPLAQGAASAALVLLSQREAGWLGRRMGAWLDDGGAGALGRMQGAVCGLGSILEASDELLGELRCVVAGWSDEAFLRRLPTARGAFAEASPAARDRLLVALDIGPSERLAADCPTLVAWAAADLAGRRAVAALGGSVARAEPATALLAGFRAENPPKVQSQARPDGGGDDGVGGGPRKVESAIGEKDRWRLILASETGELPAYPARLARALDELYGDGHGEGTAWRPGGAGGAAGSLALREWGQELQALFGPDVCDEVLAAAAGQGRVDALLEARQVTASVDLLERVLSVAGALPESKLGPLRVLARRMCDDLARELAEQLRPALTGLSSPRPTAHPGGPLDLDRTIRRNLPYARRLGGRLVVVPEHPVFRTRARRAAAWDVHVLVDVSGSMEPSTIYAALISSVLASVPALSLHFATFSTEIVDLTGRVGDPLALLLEVSVGGGTDIGKALGYVRGQVAVPSRTLLAVVSDFDDGGSRSELVGHTRALAESGVRMIGLAAVDGGQGRYNPAIAAQLVAAGMPIAALSPLQVAQWVGKQVRGER